MSSAARQQSCLLCGESGRVWNASWIAAHFQVAHYQPPAGEVPSGDAGEPVPGGAAGRRRALVCEGCGKVIDPPVPRMEAQDRDGKVIARWHRPSHAYSMLGPSVDHRYVTVSDAAPPPPDPHVTDRIYDAARAMGRPIDLASRFPGPVHIAAIARAAAAEPIDVVYQYALAFGFTLPREPDDVDDSTDGGHAQRLLRCAAAARRTNGDLTR